MKIKIEKPCHEDWSKMTLEAQRKFCSACEKSVVDFSVMSDAQILQYFSRPRPQKVCGRFNADQVDRVLVNGIPVKPSPPIHLLHFAYVLVLVLGVGLSSCGKAVTGKPQILMGDTIISTEPAQVPPVGAKKDSMQSIPNPILPSKVIPAPKKYIKGKVKITKPPTIITVDPGIEENQIMGECVIPQ